MSIALRALIISAVLVTCFAHAPAATAQVAQRRFQMALFKSDDPLNTDLGWFEPNENQPPAPRRSVLLIPPSALASSEGEGGWVEKYHGRPESEWPEIDNQVRTSARSLLNMMLPDWSRVVAVIIDEPFWGGLQDLYPPPAFSPVGDPSFNPCPALPIAPMDLVHRHRMQMMQRVLVNIASVVRELDNGKVRVWVNFTENEMNWMSSGDVLQHCEVRMSDWYMDVVSLDVYGKDFAQIKHHYDYLFDERPTTYQQLALIPGTYSTPGAQSGAPLSAGEVATRLQGFFDYANTMNQSCWLRIGRVGITRSGDGCPVWLIAGFWGETDVNYDDTLPRAPIFNPVYSQPIRNKWSEQFQLPQRNGLLGTIEQFDIPSGVVSGWAVDRTAPDQPPAVDVWLFSLNTQNPTPPVYLGGTEPTNQRPDVEGGTGISLAGFAFSIPVAYRQVAGCHEYTVYAVARPPGVGNVVLGSKKVGCP